MTGDGSPNVVTRLLFGWVLGEHTGSPRINTSTKVIKHSVTGEDRKNIG